MPSISHSQLETWGQCPRRYRLSRIDRVPQAPSDNLIFGDAIHQAIEMDGKRLMDGKPGLSVTALAGVFEAALEYRAAKDDPTGLLTGTLPDLRLRALATLRAYVERVQPHYHPVAVELPFTLPIPNLDDWQFTGRIDAITERDGKTTIVDLKTASKPWARDIEHTKEQATAYQWASGLALPRVTFIVFPTVATAEGYTCPVEYRPTVRSSAHITAYIEHVRNTVGRIEEAKRSNVFPASVGPLCAWCSVVSSCEEGQAYLARTGRKIAVPALPVTAR